MNICCNTVLKPERFITEIVIKFLISKNLEQKTQKDMKMKFFACPTIEKLLKNILIILLRQFLLTDK